MKMRRYLTSAIAAAAIILMAVNAWAFLNLAVPAGAIKYSDGSFARNGSSGVLHNVINGNAASFLSKNYALTQIVGYAHIGQSGYTQAQANALIAKIQIWGWKNLAHNGVACSQDAAGGSKWILLSELDPASDASGGTEGNVVGWQVTLDQMPGTSAWADIWQKAKSQAGAGITMQPGESWLLLIRVVAVNGVTNLCTDPTDPASEQWYNGDADSPVGSGVTADKYTDANGNSPGTSDARLPSQAIVSVMVDANN